MADVAAYNAGCRILSATARDEKHPAMSIIDGYESTYWCSTGLFPHEFILQFESTASVKGIKIHCSDVKDLMIEKTEHDDVNDFQPLIEETLPSMNGALQQHSFDFPETNARHLRFIVKSGYSSFVSVHKVSVDGTILWESGEILFSKSYTDGFQGAKNTQLSGAEWVRFKLFMTLMKGFNPDYRQFISYIPNNDMKDSPKHTMNCFQTEEEQL